MNNELVGMILSSMLSGMNGNGVLSSQQMKQILEQNLDKNMVQRLLNPGIFPVMHNQDASYSTHLMGSSDNMAFPWITQNPQTGGLELAGSWEEAIQNALERNDAIRFNSPDEAQYFGENYKQALR